MAALFDPLFCPEEPFIEEDDHFSSPIEEKSNLFDSTELLSSLLAKAPAFELTGGSLDDDPYLHLARNDAVQWIKSASARFGFSALTTILAVDYLDRCFLSSNGLRLQQDKPWMKQLSAVACLALAAKVEETQVPFLLDLQIPPAAAEEATGFVFESKTIRRMELLVLSTLGWRMNPVTALAFVQCVLPKLKSHSRSDAAAILRSCEWVLLAVLSDWRWVQYSPSVWAAAAMQQALGRHCDETPRIMELLQVSKERVEMCNGLIVELLGVRKSNSSNKRKGSCYSDPPSPSGVISSCCFSYESSSSLDSWLPSSVSSSPEPPPLKKPNCSII